MKSDPTDTLAVLREVVEHAGPGALPERLAHGYFASGSIELKTATGRRWELWDSEARDLCDGYWLRRLEDVGTDVEDVVRGHFGDNDMFESVAKYILALDADVARRVFARERSES